LGDTAWELFHRLDRPQVTQYLEDRRQKGFTVIQAVILAEKDGLHTPNKYGDLPLVNDDPTQPNVTAGSTPSNATEYDYWDHVDWVISTAEEKGLYVALLPTWGDKVPSTVTATGPVIFTETNAKTYGRYVGNRYKNSTNIIWVLGGDRRADDVSVQAIWDQMAQGIQEGVGTGTSILMSWHPRGGVSSSRWFHSDSWLDFNSYQSGHATRDIPVWDTITSDYKLTPTKPSIDMEPSYEDHPIMSEPTLVYFRDYDIRKQVYRSVFAGGFGVTYGNHSIWQFYQPGISGSNNVERYWNEALNRPGATQMHYLKNLILSRPFFYRIPDQAMVTSAIGTGGDHIRATRDSSGSYAMVYIPSAISVSINMAVLSGGASNQIKAWRYNPTNGTSQVVGTYANSGSQTFSPSSFSSPDWVLVLDDASKNFSAPGVLSSSTASPFPSATAIASPTPTRSASPIPTRSASPTPTPIPGDANGDRTVDGVDYTIWVVNYGTRKSGGASVGDFNTDGVIDGVDYTIWVVHY
jgi:hypothetical protein